jgi:phosphopantothenoylcysteine decarboxylase/phosphopantothenate--cysteine ligase
MSATGPRIVLGVSGGIGAYKAAEILRGLQKRGADVTVAMTRHATEFITPLTLQTLSGKPVAMDLYDLGRGADIEHIELVRRTDLLLVAPATANLVGKFASGVADDFLSTFYTAVKCPVLIAPAMNTRMWTSGAMQDNVRRLLARGVGFVHPESGLLACGEEGEGRLAAPSMIVDQAMRLATRGRSLEKLVAIVTAGPTREPIDPVRYVTNRSSGRMGYAIAEALARRGAKVTLVSGPTSLGTPYGVTRVDVETAAQFAAEVRRLLPGAGALWMAAAVADFRPGRPAREKLSKRAGAPVIRWEATEDVLASAGRRRSPRQVLVGFAAETGSAVAKARRKLREKNVDFIVANDVTLPGVGFDHDTNAVTVIPRSGRAVTLALASKAEIADRLVDIVHGPEEGASRSAKTPRAGGAARGAAGSKTKSARTRRPPASATRGGAPTRAARRGGGRKGA